MRLVVSGMIGEPGEPFLHVGEAVAHVGVSSQTLRRWDRDGRLSAVRRPGNDYRYYRRQADLSRALAESRNAASPQEGSRTRSAGLRTAQSVTYCAIAAGVKKAPRAFHKVAVSTGAVTPGVSPMVSDQTVNRRAARQHPPSSAGVHRGATRSGTWRARRPQRVRCGARRPRRGNRMATVRERASTSVGRSRARLPKRSTADGRTHHGHEVARAHRHRDRHIVPRIRSDRVHRPRDAHFVRHADR